MELNSWTSYPSIFTLGHKAIADLLTRVVNVEEKIDGSQLSFGLVPASPVDAVFLDHDEHGPLALKFRSKGCVMHIDAPEKMFSKAAVTVKALAEGGLLHPTWTYRSEFLAKPKHNSLAYDRVPKDHIIIFDVSLPDGGFLSYEDKVAESNRIGLEVVPRLFSGRIQSPEEVRQYLSTQSVLGGQQIEGVVIKPQGYDLYGLDKKCLFGKFVSEAFKEVHRKAWGESNPSKDTMTSIAQRYTTAARWNKAVLHLREEGLITGDVKDIGLIMKSVPVDVLKECQEEIKEDLFKWAWPHIRRQLTSGLPQWYKEKLLKDSFETNPMSEE